MVVVVVCEVVVVVCEVVVVVCGSGGGELKYLWWWV